MSSNNSPPLSILIVEDHADTAQSTAEMLSLYGHKVRIAHSGEEALAASTVETPDVVLLDVGLPGMDGWEAVTRMRDQIRGKQPFVVAVTAYGTVDDRWRSADSGVDLHLVKPVLPPALMAVLNWFREITTPHESTDTTQALTFPTLPGMS